MTEYVTLITPDPQDWDSLSAALDAHRRRRPRDGRIRRFAPAEWRRVWPVVTPRMRSYTLPAPWWDRARAWGRP